MKHLFFFPVFVLVLSACSSTKTGVQRETPASGFPSANATGTAIAHDSIREKYSKLLRVPRKEIINIRLYAFISEWFNTPYRWGGNSKSGIDCSAFIKQLFKQVYDLDIPRTSIEQLYTKQVEVFGSVKYLSEGDILFFKTTGNMIVSHVGVYLANGMFVNSSSSKGVSIANLQEPYWKKRFVAAGRLK